MKILHVEAGMHLYGGALQVVFLMRGLKALGVQNVLACPTGSAIGQAGAAHATVHEMPMKGDADVGLVGRLSCGSRAHHRAPRVECRAALLRRLKVR